MRATGFTHVSVPAHDLEVSAAFYVDLFGMERIPHADFRLPVVWLRLGAEELHLFRADSEAPALQHFGLDVDDFGAVYARARALGVLDGTAWSADIQQLPDGALQAYLRDPAGNLVEINARRPATLDAVIAGEIRKLSDRVPQSDQALRSKLYPAA